MVLDRVFGKASTDRDDARLLVMLDLVSAVQAKETQNLLDGSTKRKRDVVNVGNDSFRDFALSSVLAHFKGQRRELFVTAFVERRFVANVSVE